FPLPSCFVPLARHATKWRAPLDNCSSQVHDVANFVLGLLTTGGSYAGLQERSTDAPPSSFPQGEYDETLCPGSLAGGSARNRRPSSIPQPNPARHYRLPGKPYSRQPLPGTARSQRFERREV